MAGWRKRRAAARPRWFEPLRPYLSSAPRKHLPISENPASSSARCRGSGLAWLEASEMSVGATVRRMFGRHERLIAEIWRAGFVDLDDLFRRVREWIPNPKAILEIGCGEGAGTERLTAAY